MANNKKSFVLYCDLIKTVSKLPNDKAGELFKHLLEYVNDLEPKTDDLLIDVAFEPIKQQLKRDLIKWGETKDVKSKSGKEGNLKRWNLDIYSEYKKGKYTLNESLIIAKDRKATKSIANIAVNDTVNVTVNDTVINKEDAFEIFWERYGKKGTRKKALDKWMKLKQHEIDKAFKVVDSYVKSTPDKQYRKGCESWIHNECWNDSIFSKSKIKSSTSFGSEMDNIIF